MTQTEFNTLKELISKSVNNSHKIGVNLDDFMKLTGSDLKVFRSQNETIINNQNILDAKLNKLLANK